MQYLRSADHIDVRIDSYHLRRTYLGLLEGKPDRKINQEIVESFTQSLQEVWGHRTLLMIWQKEGLVSAPADVLPAWICAAWASSDFPPREDDHGSELVIVWFEESISNMDIESCTARIINLLDWQKYATGFCY